METCLAGADDWRGGSGPLVLERGPATNPLFGAFFEAVQQAGYPLTDDVNGYRQEGFAALRPQRAPGPPAVSGPGLPAPGDGPQEPQGRDVRARPPRSSSRASAPSASTTCARGRLQRHARANEVILCGGAINSPQLLQLSGVGIAADLEALGIDVVHDSAGRRPEPPGPPRGLHPVRVQAAGLDRARPALPQPAEDRLRLAVLPQGPRRHQPLRGRRLLPAATRTSTTPT